MRGPARSVATQEGIDLLDLQGPGKKCYSRAGREATDEGPGGGCRKEWEEAPDFLLLPTPFPLLGPPIR